MFEIPAALLSWFYGLTASYTIAIGLMAIVVIAVTTPLMLKSTKGMLEMQRLEPELHQLQDAHRNDRVRLNEEMRKLYQEHKVNPAVSFLPLLAQAAVFIVMFRVLRGLDVFATWFRPADCGRCLGGIRSSGSSRRPGIHSAIPAGRFASLRGAVR